MAMFEGIEDILQKISSHSEYSKALVTLASAVGILVIIFYSIKFIHKLIQGSRLYVFSQLGCCQANFVERYGQWVVVTGATDGIGLAMAKELVRRGMSIIVVGRNDEKLARVKALLEAEPNAGAIETVRIDLSDSSIENFARVRAQIDPDNRDIGILINNAGAAPDEFKRFNRFDMESSLNIANLNMIAPLHMTRMIMPGMVARGKGMIVNVSSVLGSMTGCYMGIYACTKTFIDAFTRQLQAEYSSHPIDIIALTTGPVFTKLLTESSRTAKPNLMIPSSEYYAHTAINALSTRIARFSGTITHGIQKEILHFFMSLGVMPAMVRASLSFNAKSLNLSPVPKRRQIKVLDGPAPREAAGDAGYPNSGV